MPVDLKAWRKVVEQTVGAIADESLQRRSWFGLGPEISSPGEEFNQFFGDSAIVEFLQRDDNGLNDLQAEAARHLVKLMEDLSSQLPQHIKPEDLIDDPRWKRIRVAAARFSALLEIDGATAR
ncbi:MAG TPA: hypothetical protein VG742_12235 [Dongiaceae bacterium]|nr:hypothetical protein [Dongiaceae bacterium]